MNTPRCKPKSDDTGLSDILPVHVRARPSLWLSLVLAAVITAAVATTTERFSKAVLIGWCCGAAFYLAIAARRAIVGTVEGMRKRSARYDLGSGFIFFVTMFAAVASITAIVADLSQVRQDGPAVLVLSAATLLLSWFFVHTVFAFHYAHLFYVDPASLSFPNTKEPDYWDFLYFALVIGMTAQVSDVTTGTQAMRRLVLVHSVIAFFFNTAVLALGVNLAASAVGTGS